MNAENVNSFVESAIYKDPKSRFDKIIKIFEDREVVAYLNKLKSAENPKDDRFQEEFKTILKQVLENDKEKAGLLFNIHRTLTAFRGYAASDKASSDVNAAFEKFEVPEEGMIVVDFFVTRNLPAIIKKCEEKNIDLNRIRVVVPEAVLATQLMQMNEEKREEFESACAKLTAKQFVTTKKDGSIAFHNADLDFNEKDEKIALWFSPRTMPITPKLQAETEEETINNYVNYFREKIKNVVNGGEIFANLAFSEEFSPLQVEVASKKRKLTKLTGISKNVASKIIEMLEKEEGFKHLGKEIEINPEEIDPEIDHAKKASWMHFKKNQHKFVDFRIF